MENNPESYINIDYNEQTNRFIRYFISFKACIDGFNYCRPMLFLDGTFLKGKFKGNLLALLPKMATKFLGYVANVVDSQRTLTFVSDRHPGLIESIPILFPTAHHAFCLQHLQCNLQDKLRYENSSYRAGILSKFRAGAYAPTVFAFNYNIEEFIKCGPKVVPVFLKDLSPHYWSNAYFRYVIIYLFLPYLLCTYACI
ncbi:hypothetical protein ACSBR1_005623 [Camellia fascicularis]